MVVFFDIDGTIIDEPTQIIPESTVRAIQKLRENGHIPVVNTGRPLGHIQPGVRKLPFAGWICACGTEIWLGGEKIFDGAPDAAMCRYVIETVRDCDGRVVYEADGGCILTDGEFSKNHPLCEKKVRAMKAQGFTEYEVDALEEPRFLKFMFYQWDGYDKAEFARRMEGKFEFIDRGLDRLEIIPSGCNKSRGMHILMERLGLPMEDSLAIGDSTNDLPMFETAAHTVCMGDGVEEAKTAVEYVTANVLDDGVEKALIHFGLIE